MPLKFEGVPFLSTLSSVPPQFPNLVFRQSRHALPQNTTQITTHCIGIAVDYQSILSDTLPPDTGLDIGFLEQES